MTNYRVHLRVFLGSALVPVANEILAYLVLLGWIDWSDASLRCVEPVPVEYVGTGMRWTWPAVQ